MASSWGGDSWVREWARRIDALGLSPIVGPLLSVVQDFGVLASPLLRSMEPLLAGTGASSALLRFVALLEQPKRASELQRLLRGSG
jgi:hypothetical protein